MAFSSFLNKLKIYLAFYYINPFVKEYQAKYLYPWDATGLILRASSLRVY
jgi:hypothetical protein